MNFTNPWAFAFLIFIPLIILMYILKQKFEEKEISSTFLWNATLKDIEVNTPWQKLKKNLLLLIQILIVTFFIFAVGNPSLLMKGKAYDNVIIVIDNSGSMNALENGEKGIERAKIKAEKLVKTLKKDSKLTIISSGMNSKIEIGNTTSKEEAIKKIRKIQETNSKGNTNNSITLVKSISRQYENYRTYFFTDTDVNLEGINGQVISVVANGDNVSLDYISHGKDEKKLNVLIRVSNRSNNNLDREILLYGEDELLDIKEISLKPMEISTIYFNEDISSFSDNIPKYLKAEITEKDMLLEDNVIYDVVKQNSIKKTLLVSENNVFMEKALNTIKNIELYKTNSVDEVIEEYDLYIFDGMVPKTFPKEGGLLLINPPDNSLVKVEGISEGGFGSILESSITDYMENAYFTVSKLKNIELPYWAQEIMKVGDKNGAFIGDRNGRKLGSINFDLHKSDFALTTEFPVFIHNLVNYIIGTDFIEKTKLTCGEDIKLNLSPDAVKAYIETPLNEKDNLKITYPMRDYNNTDSAGIYTIVQKAEDREIKNIFAVNFPSDSESQINKKIKQTGEVHSFEGEEKLKHINVRVFIILGILALVILEWIVYIGKRVRH